MPLVYWITVLDKPFFVAIFYMQCSLDGNNNDLCIVFAHQSLWQQRMLQRYGNKVCLIDATYNCTAYDMPLYALCVPTN